MFPTADLNYWTCKRELHSYLVVLSKDNDLLKIGTWGDYSNSKGPVALHSCFSATHICKQEGCYFVE